MREKVAIRLLDEQRAVLGDLLSEDQQLQSDKTYSDDTRDIGDVERIEAEHEEMAETCQDMAIRTISHLELRHPAQKKVVASIQVNRPQHTQDAYRT